MSEKETVEVTVKVPKGIVQFLNDIIPVSKYDSLQEYLTEAIVSRVEGDIDADVFSPTVKSVAIKYSLKEEFEIKD
jgi:hypothetical protein